ncbi:hypothetical protein K32_39090 [Kaistia sp. 32K]|uniref:GNAT family N-acetyltransferase n=1 Tax=Kaistia sp. 32K TaxID=2795690 RepID=UPI001914DD96|nr:GNAT family N-acetyltransferase [Kaistia sp. 32K]BCP55292.1 hypothetical protein K32_39090 [Kaistia sp. 32K]
MTAARSGSVDHPAEENPFFAPALLTAALDHLADGKVELVLLAGDDDAAIALAPIHPTRLGRLVPAVAVWVHSLGPLGTPLLDAGDPDRAAAGLIAAMDGAAPGRRILEFPYLPLAGPIVGTLQLQARLQGRPIAWIGTHQRAILRRNPGDGTGLLPAIAPKKRKELARQFRRLAELGSVTTGHTNEPEAVLAALDEFFALEASGWKGRRGTALALRPQEKAFAIAAVTEAARTGDVAIDAIRLDGRAIAMLISFRAGASAVTWKIAFDEAYARFSPGVHVMLQASERLAGEAGIDCIDSLAVADHPMVDHLWPDRLEIGTLVIGPKGGSLAYRLGLALARLEIRARPIVKNRIREARKLVGTARARLRRSASSGSPAG